MNPPEVAAIKRQADVSGRMGRLRLLHLSDLHLGKEASTSAWRLRRVLGNAWAENLKSIADDGPVDLVCFTGDLAQSGQPAQYQQASEFIGQLLQTLKVPRSRFFCVPGNHDVDRSIEPAAWRALRSAASEVNGAAFGRYLAPGGKTPRGCKSAWPEQVLARQAAYRAWLQAEGFDHLLPQHSPHGRLGWRVTLDLNGLPLHLAGLDSAWLAGDDHDATQLRLTDEQVARLLTDAEGNPLPGAKLALLHHPFGEIGDGRAARRLLCELGVHLLLHGHLHDPELERWSTPAHLDGEALHLSAAGCLYEDDAYPNSLQLLDLQLSPQGLTPLRLWARCWSARGHWHHDDSLYPGSQAGRLDLQPAAPVVPATAATPGTFIGRSGELDRLCQALLPALQGQAVQPTVLCCAIEGMPGVGKTRLAEQFVREHWLPAVGLQPLDETADLVLRLVLPPDPSADAQGLGQQVADRLRSSGPPATLWPRLAQALRHGPCGRPRLLLIENVDGAAAAQSVGRLVNQLPGCPILVTARWRGLGGSGWQRVSVPPMPLEEARALLLEETEGQSGHRLTPAEADDLALRLGRLPLALHIAASHLNLGLTPRAFLQQLKATGLQLPPADPADPRLTADQARAILHSSFELSWRQWLLQYADGHPWQAAPVRLAFGPPTAIGLSLAAALGGLDDSDAASAMAAAAARLSLLELTGGRIQLHPLIAEFLRDKALADADTVRQAMGAWFEARLPQTGDEKQGEAWRAVWSEFDALQHWLALMPYEEGLRAERLGSRFSISMGPYGAWQALCSRLLAESTVATDQSNLLFTLAMVANLAGDPETARSAAQRKLQIDRHRGEDRDAAIAAGLVADVLKGSGDLNESLRIYREEALPLYERLGDQRSRAITMGKIADVLLARGNLDEALRIYREEALPFHQEFGDQRERALVMGQIADVLQARGDLAEALRIRREEELPVYEMLGEERSRVIAIGRIADALQARGELNEALRIRRDEELPVYRKLGDRRSCAITSGKIAEVLKTLGELDEALRILRDDVVPVYLDLGDPAARAVNAGRVAAVLAAQGDLDEALLIRREEELPVYEMLGDPRDLLVGRTNLALLLIRFGATEKRSEADTLLRQAHAVAQQLRLPEAGQIEQIYQQAFGRSIADPPA